MIQGQSTLWCCLPIVSSVCLSMPTNTKSKCLHARESQSVMSIALEFKHMLGDIHACRQTDPNTNTNTFPAYKHCFCNTKCKWEGILLNTEVHIEGFQPEWYTSTMYQGFLTRMVYLYLRYTILVGNPRYHASDTPFWSGTLETKEIHDPGPVCTTR